MIRLLIFFNNILYYVLDCSGSDFPQVNDGPMMNVGDEPFNVVIEYMCNPGFSPLPVNNNTCLEANEGWESSAPTCTPGLRVCSRFFCCRYINHENCCFL